jgi:hypothetical protein
LSCLARETATPIKSPSQTPCPIRNSGLQWLGSEMPRRWLL